MPLLPDLVTSSYAAQGLAPAALNAAQQAFIPSAITAASNQIRRWCMGNNFTQQTYAGEIYPVALDGYIRLAQIPVNQILSVQSDPTTALTVTNSSPSVQQATIAFSLTGDLETGQTVTGFTLSWVSNGTPQTAPIVFVANQQVSDVAALINAVGSGWGASVNQSLGSWPVTELDGGLVGQGADDSLEAAEFKVWARYRKARPHPDDGMKSGIIWVGQEHSGISDRWGPYPADWADTATNPGVVKISYNAGYAVIPPIVQLACVEIVKIMLQRLKINPYLASETAGEYSYDLAWQALLALPPYILTELSQYRILNA